jgi:hypothetical protein
LVKGARGWFQGYNAQAVANEQQIVIAAEVSVAAPDFGHLEPMLDAAHRELEAAGVTDRPQTVLADAGYWHHEQMERIVAAGTQVLIPPDSGKRKGNRPGWTGGLYSLKADLLGDSQRLADLHKQFDYRKLPMADAVRIGLVEEIVHGPDGERRTYRRPRVPLAPRSIQMVCRALAQILDAALLDGLLKANPARESTWRSSCQSRPGHGWSATRC